MASTYRPIQAFDKAESYIKGMPLRDVQVRILDQAHKFLWMYKPWRWTIGSLPDVTLVAGTTDYSIALPSDFLYGTDAHLTDQDDQNKTIIIEPALHATAYPGSPSRIAITGTAGSTGQMRVHPKPAQIGSPVPVIISLYKKSSTVLTPENINTTGVLSLPDEWFWVFEAGVLWQAYRWADDARAGSVTYSAGRGAQYTGMYAEFLAALDYMASKEKLPLAEPTSYTEDRKTRG